ncbi:CusA/CzcA family heavy metal efflux RND transporter [Reichenbachiella ulvae]|uniref:CusA/CzcA family heavy metal efflux RND transporter n=1 Tax=Reichenbachiella ulvae TaxID=2980104 RepID=A0ABT3CP69_9BACT|nr:CusA/CzcA family heavy metal efflux RND transporter [Reichenbachiella ulvae]MCV9385412.1 CusA/CzcA family heavy metal efflux RND transporter [Reichenbachiella ulvae]
MINQIIAFSIKNKMIVGLLTIALIAGGLYSMTQVPVDAVPDITNNQVQVMTQAPNLGTEDIEQFVTYPVELAMANLPGVQEIRSVSRFGLSLVTIVFDDEMGTYLPRQLVAEKLSKVKEEIPAGFGEPEMGPISTGLGEIYQYVLEVDPKFKSEYSPTELRTIQDWIVRRQMAMVPGVVEVNSFGGSIKQYEVAVNPDELNAMGLTIMDIFEALERNNQNTGGAYIEKDHYANFIRGEGLARELKDIENILVTRKGGVPITVKDVAQVRFGEAVRYGVVTKDGEGEAVGGMILMLKGSNSDKVISAVKDRVEEIQKSLPKGVQIVPFLDRSKLIANTTSTVSENLILGALIVIFVLVFLLGNWRGGLIVATTIPLSLLFAFIMMHAFDVWANLMSLGAIDFGIIVDGAVIIVEGTVFFLSEKVLKKQKITGELRAKMAYESSSKMMNAAFFGQLIILIVFIPLLALEGVEGKMFKPMALTFMFAMIGVMILCLTYVPMMSAWFLRVGDAKKTSWGDRLVGRLESVYDYLLQKALGLTGWILGGALLLFALAIFTFTRMGGEFIPKLDEGDIAFHIILRPGSSLTEGKKISTEVEKKLLSKFPEIDHVISRYGVADVPTDPMPMDVADCFVILKPTDTWTSAETKAELIELIKAEVDQMVGINYEFTQPIEMRFNELITGVREDVAIKLFGEDLEILAVKVEEIGKLVSGIEGVADLKVEATSGLPQMTVKYDRRKLAQYGLHIDELNVLIESAFAGGKAGVIFEGEKRFDLVVRLDRQHRQSIDDLRKIYVPMPNGAQVPLKEVASISYQSGPMQIGRDNTQRRTYVGINVRGRDVKSVVEDIKERLEADFELPPGYYIRYGGAFENLERASKRLEIVVPIALGLIFVIIFFALKSLSQTFMIFMAIPLAAVGGVFTLWLRDMPFSISAGVGFIVLFGVAVLNGLVLINGWNELKEEGLENLNERIRLGAKRRIRPILLTALTDVLGFLPMAISSSAGAEVQRPLATVVIGGMITATLLTLFVLPLLYRWSETTKFQFSIPKKAMAVLAILIVSVSGLKAQELPITLEDALDRANREYPKIKAAQLEIKKQEAGKKSAWQLGNTNIFTAGEEINDGQGVYTTIGIQQQNIDVFGVASKMKLQKERVALAGAALDLSRLELAYQLKSSYGKLFAAQKQMQLYETIDSAFQEFERAAKLRYETEETSYLAYLAAVNQSKKIRIEKEQKAYDYQMALQQFNQWMVSDTLFLVSPLVPEEWDQPIESSLDSLAAHPVLQLRDQQSALAAQQWNTAKAGFLPKLNLQYGFQEIEGQGGFYQYQAGVSIPLFFMNQQGKVQSAQLNYHQSQENISQARLEMKSAYLTALSSYQKWKSSWQYYETEALHLAGEQRAAALKAYQMGTIDYVTFLQNTKDAMQIEINAWDAFEQYLNSRFKLEYFINQ